MEVSSLMMHFVMILVSVCVFLHPSCEWSSGFSPVLLTCYPSTAISIRQLPHGSNQASLLLVFMFILCIYHDFPVPSVTPVWGDSWRTRTDFTISNNVKPLVINKGMFWLLYWSSGLILLLVPIGHLVFLLPTPLPAPEGFILNFPLLLSWKSCWCFSMQSPCFSMQSPF